MNNPLVSVILPTHNRTKFLRHAIKSVLAQTERNIELIVVDDASTDETNVVLNQLACIDTRIKILRNPESLGGGGARNVGIAASSGEWVAFLDDDDEWVATKLRTQLDELTANSATVACSCSYKLYYSSGSSKVVDPPENITLNQLLRGNYLGGASMCMCSREALLGIGGFDEKFRSGQDWDFWVRLRQAGDIVVCKEPLVEYRNHDGVRISNNMDAQYMGARRFYFKHRKIMDESLQKFNVSYNCFIMSRQTKRRLSSRLRYLILSLRHSGYQVGSSYVLSSLPRLIRDCFGN
jgi:glycosyltransferase involved in cell wall biosynthesis